jgi:cell division inhibitor SulA
MNSILDELKNKKMVWHATHNKPFSGASTSGFNELDAQLEGGFPKKGVVDIHSPVGIGELRLLMPYLHLRQNKDPRLLVFIAPPMQLNPEMLAEYGLTLSQILIIQPQEAKKALWAAEQCLKSGCCYGVLVWHQTLQIHHIKRLQLAAEQGDALNVIFRRQQELSFSLPVSLGIKLDAHPQGLNVQITKRKGGWPQSPFPLDMRQHWPELTISPAADNILRFPIAKVS